MSENEIWPLPMEPLTTADVCRAVKGPKRHPVMAAVNAPPLDVPSVSSWQKDAIFGTCSRPPPEENQPHTRRGCTRLSREHWYASCMFGMHEKSFWKNPLTQSSPM